MAADLDLELDMKQGWTCPVCGAGVAPERAHCEHPVNATILPEGFPDKATIEAAAILYPELDVAHEARKFRIHYGAERSGRWPHVWQRWLEGERAWCKSRPAAAAAAPTGNAKTARIPRIKVWQGTRFGTRFESSMELADYEYALTQGTAPELVDDGELPRLRALAKALQR